MLKTLKGPERPSVPPAASPGSESQNRVRLADSGYPTMGAELTTVQVRERKTDLVYNLERKQVGPAQ